MSARSLRRGLLVAGLALVAAAPAGAAAPGSTSVFAPIPAPGYPAHAYVHPDGRVYEGTYVNHAAAGVPSKVFELSGAGGAPTRTWTMTGQDTGEGEQGVQVATSDARGRLVLLDRRPARALLLDRATGRTTEYARFPDLRPCGSVPLADDCEPGGDERPMPNYAAWLPDGSLLVTDYQQDVIWRVPPGGGTPHVWLGVRSRSSEEYGYAGIVLSADRRTVYVTQASNFGNLDAPDPNQGKLLAVPLLPDGDAGPIATVWTSPGIVDLPDGFAVSKAGNFYVALVGLAAQVVKLGPQGQELGRFGVPILGLNDSPVAFDSPSSARFLGTRILVANQSAIFGNAGNQAILAVETGEQGQPEYVPAGAGSRPAAPAPAPAAPAVLPRLRVQARPSTIRAGRRTTVRIRVTAVAGGSRHGVARATVRVQGRRLRGDRRGSLRVVLAPRRAGRIRVTAAAAGHRAGSAVVTVRDAG